MEKYKVVSCKVCQRFLGKDSKKVFCSEFCKNRERQKAIGRSNHQKALTHRCITCNNLRAKPGKCKSCKKKHRLKTVKIKPNLISNSKKPLKIKTALTGFYTSDEWRKVRYEAIKRYERRCMVCFRSGIELHVDHIKPRSQFPELELNIDNLQILCVDCNLGKRNYDQIDWRHKESSM